MKMILRSWFRSALSSTISLLSLAIGLLCSTILLLFAVTEFRMAKSLGNDTDTYFVEQIALFDAAGGFHPIVEKELIADIADKYPEVVDWAVIGICDWWQWEFDTKISYEPPYTISATPSFAKFINVPMEVGGLDSVLAHPNAIAITRTYANQIFPGEDPIGKTISGEQVDGFEDEDGNIHKENKTLVVEGIIDDKFRSFLQMRAIFSRSEDNVRTIPNDDMFSALIKLHKDVDPDIFMEKIVNDSLFSEKYDFEITKIRLQKISEAYFKFSDVAWGPFKTRDKNTLIIGLSVAIIVLVVSVFNYLYITLIRAPRRLKNWAGQRIMGASRAQVAGQILAETSLHVLVSFGIACVFMQFAMQQFNSFMGSSMFWQDLLRLNNLTYLLMLLSLLIILPTFYLIMKFNIKKPMEVFKNPSGNKIQYLGSLVVLQMIVSVVLIAFSINVKRQMDYIVSVVPQAHQIIHIHADDWEMSQEFIDRVIQSASTTDCLLGCFYPNHYRTDENGEVFKFVSTDPNIFNFLRIPIVMGRAFDSIPSNIKQVVANKAYLKAKKIEGDPIGYEFNIDKSAYRIVGICEDFVVFNATLSVEPLLYDFSNNYSSIEFLIRFQGSLEDKTKEMKAIFEKYIEETNDEEAIMPRISTLTDFYKTHNRETNRLRIMVEFFTFISIFLSAMGLFGLSWYTVERRHKEMALRKVHGATTGKLLLLLCKTFFIWCTIATIIALPIGYFISRYWLQRFVYKIDNSLWTLLITALIAVAVTFVTVIFQIMRAAQAEPAKYIKME